MPTSIRPMVVAGTVVGIVAVAAFVHCHFQKKNKDNQQSCSKRSSVDDDKDEISTTVSNSTAGDSQLVSQFTESSKRVAQSSSLGEGDKLLLYGLYKQATMGDVTNDAPSKLNFVAYAKYEARKRFIGIPKEAAMMQYIGVVNELLSGNSDSRNSENDDIVYENDNGEEDSSSDEIDEDGGGGSMMSVKPSVIMPVEDETAGNDGEFLYAARSLEGVERLAALKRLVDSGVADINAVDESGQTVAHFLADRGSVEALEFLLKNDLDVNAQDHDGLTPLHVACTMNHIEVCEVLLRFGANRDAKDIDGETPRDFASTNQMRKLLIWGPKLSTPTKTSPTTKAKVPAVSNIVTPSTPKVAPKSEAKKSWADMNDSSSDEEEVQSDKKIGDAVVVADHTAGLTKINDKRRWADMDDSSDEEGDSTIPIEDNIITASQLNDGALSYNFNSQGNIKSTSEPEKDFVDPNMFGQMANDNDDSSSSEEENDNDKGIAFEGNTFDKTTISSAGLTKSTNKKLSKQEKQAQKEKDMDDLDALLNEFGITTSGDEEEKKSDEATDKSDGVVTTSKKKRKKKKKASTANKDEKDISNLKEEKIELADVSIVMKSKQSTKAKSKGTSAAAVAARELAKSRTGEKKKKKGKKPKYPR